MKINRVKTVLALLLVTAMLSGCGAGRDALSDGSTDVKSEAEISVGGSGSTDSDSDTSGSAGSGKAEGRSGSDTDGGNGTAGGNGAAGGESYVRHEGFAELDNEKYYLGIPDPEEFCNSELQNMYSFDCEVTEEQSAFIKFRAESASDPEENFEITVTPRPDKYTIDNMAESPGNVIKMINNVNCIVNSPLHEDYVMRIYWCIIDGLCLCIIAQGSDAQVMEHFIYDMFGSDIEAAVKSEFNDK